MVGVAKLKLSIPLQPHCRGVTLGNEFTSLKPSDRGTVQMEPPELHLDPIAWKSNDALHVIDGVVARQPEDDHVTSIRQLIMV